MDNKNQSIKNAYDDIERVDFKLEILRDVLNIGSMAMEYSSECVFGINGIKEEMTSYFLMLQDYCDYMGMSSKRAMDLLLGKGEDGKEAS